MITKPGSSIIIMTANLLSLSNDEQSIDLYNITLSNINVFLLIQNILLLNTILRSIIKDSVHNNNLNDISETGIRFILIDISVPPSLILLLLVIYYCLILWTLKVSLFWFLSFLFWLFSILLILKLSVVSYW